MKVLDAEPTPSQPEPDPPQPEPDPPQPEPHPPPQPTRASRYLANVYFHFGDCRLSRATERAIEAMPRELWRDDATRFSVVAHTDTFGSTEHNQKLSECRAASVVNKLRALGVPAARITGTGKGETQSAFETGDNEKDARNRRATIELLH